jgi:2-isopropylmalate synthase
LSFSVTWQSPLGFSWEGLERASGFASARPVLVDDETLRDGLQSPSLQEPTCEQKKRYLHLIAQLGVAAADLGMPAAGPRWEREVEELLREIVQARLPLTGNCAVRMLERDVSTCATISQRVGCPLEIMVFLAFSALRRQAEGWQRDFLLQKLEKVVSFGQREGLAVTFVAEDASRTSPEDLQAALLTAARSGATRLCLADTTGVLSPWGAGALVHFARHLLDEHGFAQVGLDWHGHNDRGLAVACALHAALQGADRLHGTLLGVGERVGNAPLEQLLLNLALMQQPSLSLSKLVPALREAAQLLRLEIPPNAPLLGENAFATATGVHAAAILKAREKGRKDLEEVVYLPFPPALVGGKQEVHVGPYSGAANVRYWFISRGLPVEGELVQAILAAAKAQPRVLTEEEILHLVHQYRSKAKF